MIDENYLKYTKSKSNPYLSNNVRYLSQNESDFNKEKNSQLFSYEYNNAITNIGNDIKNNIKTDSYIKNTNDNFSDFNDYNDYHNCNNFDDNIENYLYSTEGNDENNNENFNDTNNIKMNDEINDEKKDEINDEKKDEINNNQNYTKILPNVFRSEEGYKYRKKNRDNILLRKNHSQMELYNNNLSISHISHNIKKNEYYNGKKNNDLSKFIAKIKIINFYSTSEMILLIERIIDELNLNKDYSFSIKDSIITFIFTDAEEALSIFKRINIEKLNNKYYQNLSLDIIFDIKEEINENKKEIIELINNKVKEKKEDVRKIKPKKLSLLPLRREKRNTKINGGNNNNNSNSNNNINNNDIKRERFKNFRTYNYSKDNVFITNLANKQYEGLHKRYLEYLKQRKEERRKKELNYVNGKDISLLASTPFIENNNKNSFEDHLRKYKGDDVGPAKFNGYIGRASFKRDNYKESHLYEVPDFANHWKLREDNKNKWISPAKFHI